MKLQSNHRSDSHSTERRGGEDMQLEDFFRGINMGKVLLFRLG